MERIPLASIAVCIASNADALYKGSGRLFSAREHL